MVMNMLIGCLIISIEAFRSMYAYGIGWSRMIEIPGELLLTAESGLFILESNSSIDMMHSVFYSIGKIFTPNAMNKLFQVTPHFSQILISEWE